jgi:hypothetical protein
MKYLVTRTSRFLTCFFTITGVIGFLFSLPLFYYFLFDRDLLDKYKVPRVNNNDYFDLSTLKIKDNTLNRIIFNTFLALLFWLQHIIMANPYFKSFLGKISQYQTYERGLYLFGIITFNF